MKKKQLYKKYAVPVIIVLFLIIIQILNPDKPLLSMSNLKVIFKQSTVLGLVSLGLSFIIIAGETDLSIAGSVGVIGATFSFCSNMGQSLFLSFLLAFVVGMAICAVYTLLVAKFQYSAIIISICLMFICQGAERLYANSESIWIEDTSVLAFADQEVMWIPSMSIVLVAAYLLCFVFINHTKTGFHIRITGESRQTAVEVGVPVVKTKAIAFFIAFLFYIIASVFEPLRVGGSQVNAGNSYLLPAMAACYLGSSMFVPGRVNLPGTFVGSVFMSFIMNYLTIIGAPFYMTPLVQGGLLMLSVGMATINDRSIKQVKL